jgi:hypothetical protein
MSERLRLLALKIHDYPEPEDLMTDAKVMLAKAGAMMLATIPDSHSTGEEKRFLLARRWERINDLAHLLGERNEMIRMMRAMHAIAAAVIDGRPEPTDEQLGLSPSYWVRADQDKAAAPETAAKHVPHG